MTSPIPKLIEVQINLHELGVEEGLSYKQRLLIWQPLFIY